MPVRMGSSARVLEGDALIPGERRRFGIRTGLGRATRKVYDIQAPCGQKHVDHASLERVSPLSSNSHGTLL